MKLGKEYLVCFVLAMSGLLSGTSAIRCLCSDTRYCINNAGVLEEDCPDRLPLDFVERNKEAIAQDLRRPMRELMFLRDKHPEGSDMLTRLTAEQLRATQEAMVDLAKYGFQSVKKMSLPDEEAYKKIDAVIAGHPLEVTEKHDYEFCVKFLDQEGTLKRSCVIAAYPMLGPSPAIGCLIQTDPFIVDYCKCDSTRCNVGNITLTDKAFSTVSASVHVSPVMLIYLLPLLTLLY